MLKQLKKNGVRIGWGMFLLLLLVSIRAFEQTLFYDPFLLYFKQEFYTTPFPSINPIKLFFSLGFRYYLNSIISLLLIYILFKDSKIVKFSIFLYSMLGIFLMVSFFFVLTFFGKESMMTLFYIRRFIIQPILLILFIPAFYYQKISK